MKIGLLTYHHSTNNGAMLQAYATAKALIALGHEVVFIDLRQQEPHHVGIVGLLVSIIYFKRDRAIKRFKKKLYPPLTRQYYSIEDLRKNPPDVECLVVGSDQVWNPNISKDIAMAYFLDFGSEIHKRFSYASSFGLNEWPSELAITKNVQNALNHFDCFSVRELTGQTILKNTFGKKSVLVVDPTMLFDNYKELTGKVPLREEVVCYKLNRTPDFYAQIGLVKEITHLPVRLLNNSYPVKGLKYTYPPSVEEWIRRIGGARYVITDSFHGLVFSILYRRDFVVIKNNNGKDSRMIDLLNEIGLANRAYENISSLKNDTSWLAPIDYNMVMPKVNKLREKSWSYLKTALSL